jgi:hypothetical protein
MTTPTSSRSRVTGKKFVRALTLDDALIRNATKTQTLAEPIKLDVHRHREKISGAPG